MTTTIFNIVQSELIKRGYNEIVDEQGNLVFFDHDHQFMTKILKYDQDVSEIIDELFSGQSLNDPVFDQHFKKGFLYRFINRRINRQTVEAFRLQLLATFLTSEGYINRIYADVDQYLTQTATTENQNLQTNTQTSTQENISTTIQQNTQTGKQTNKNTSTQQNTQTGKQTNKQTNDGTSTSDNRQAYADLPQNNVQLDVDSTKMDSASTNEISRNKQKNVQETNSETNDQTDGVTSNETEGTTSDQSDGETSGETEGVTSNQSDGETVGETTGISKAYKLDELFKTNGLLEQIYNGFDVKCFLQVW